MTRKDVRPRGNTNLTVTLSYDWWIDVLTSLEDAYDTYLERADEAADDRYEYHAEVNRSYARFVAVRYATIAEQLPAGPLGHRISAQIIAAARPPAS